MNLRDKLIAIHKLLAPTVGNIALMLETPNMKLSQIRELERNLQQSLALVSMLLSVAEEKKRVKQG